jgi:hypothetical protein
MGNAVNLQTRQVRKIVNELHQDYLVCECVSPGGPPLVAGEGQQS